MTSKTAKPESEPAATAVTIDDAELGAEDAEKLIRPLLADRGRHVDVTLGKSGANVSDEYVDALFGSLMQSAMAAGGRRLAVEWMNRLQVLGNAGERAHRAMAKTINLDLRFGMLAPPLAEQAGCRPEVLQHEQQDADCIARLAVRGVATDGEVHRCASASSSGSSRPCLRTPGHRPSARRRRNPTGALQIPTEQPPLRAGANNPKAARPVSATRHPAPRARITPHAGGERLRRGAPLRARG